MANIPHPGEHFAATLKQRGITAYECAGAMGVRPPRIYDLAKCQTSVSPALALRLSRYLGGSPESWMRRQAMYDLAIAERVLGDELQGITRARKPLK